MSRILTNIWKYTIQNSAYTGEVCCLSQYLRHIICLKGQGHFDLATSTQRRHTPSSAHDTSQWFDTSQPTKVTSIWFEIWGSRGSGFENWEIVGLKSSTDGGTNT